MPTRTEILTQDKIRRLSEIEAPYLRAKEYEKSERYVADCIQALAKIRGIITLGKLDEAEAMRAIGRVQQVLIDLCEYELVISEYEGIKKTLAEMYPKEAGK